MAKRQGFVGNIYINGDGKGVAGAVWEFEGNESKWHPKALNVFRQVMQTSQRLHHQNDARYKAKLKGEPPKGS